MGFTRRVGYYPSDEFILQIEGVVIVDQPQPGQIAGAGTGVVACVGEFVDCTYATTVDANGNVSTKIAPVQIFGSTDLISKVGGFDPTIGDFGVSEGNGFAALRNKRYASLVAIPVNLASSKGTRYCRELPMNTSPTNTNPVVPVQPATVLAGTEFRSGAGRLRTAGPVNFTAFSPIATGTNASMVAAAPAATQNVNAGGAALRAWQVDITGPTFVNMTSEFNDSAAGDLVPFPASEAIGDYFAVGAAAPFGRLQFSSVGGTAGVAGVVGWEYWNGAAWAPLSNVVDGTDSFTEALGGDQIVTFDIPNDWAQNTLNSVMAYYVRAVISTVYTTNPAYTQGFVGGTPWNLIVRPDGALGVYKGDIIVLGYNLAGSIAPAASGGSLGGGTYRVASDPAAGSTVLSVERLDGASFALVAAAEVPWRLHYCSDADSAPTLVFGNTGPGGYSASEPGGYVVPTRPLTNEAGANTNGTWTAGLVTAPAVAPAATTGSTWDPLSGLVGRVMPGLTGGLTFTAAVQGVNPPSSSSLDALYVTALQSLLTEELPAREVNLVFCARHSAIIASSMRADVLNASAIGLGHMAIIAPPLNVQSVDAAIADAYPGVGANRDERVVYSWPGARTYINEAQNVRIKTADGNTTIDGVLDQGFDSWIASVMSILAPERDPGQSAPPVPELLARVLGYQRGVSNLGLSEYIVMKAKGIAGLKMDRTVGPVVQSGVTTSLISGQTDINRRRFADFIEDSVAAALQPFTKLPLTTELRDGVDTQINSFLLGLQSPNNPAAQRIDSFSVDSRSGNTPDSLAKGIYVVKGAVRMTPIAKAIVFVASVGPGVDTSVVAAT